MLLGQELKFKNKLCNLKLGTFFSALPGGGGGSDNTQGGGNTEGGGTTGGNEGDGLE